MHNENKVVEFYLNQLKDVQVQRVTTKTRCGLFENLVMNVVLLKMLMVMKKVAHNE